MILFVDLYVFLVSKCVKVEWVYYVYILFKNVLLIFNFLDYWFRINFDINKFGFSCGNCKINLIMNCFYLYDV